MSAGLAFSTPPGGFRPGELVDPRSAGQEDVSPPSGQGMERKALEPTIAPGQLKSLVISSPIRGRVLLPPRARARVRKLFPFPSHQTLLTLGVAPVSPDVDGPVVPPQKKKNGLLRLGGAPCWNHSGGSGSLGLTMVERGLRTQRCARGEGRANERNKVSMDPGGRGGRIGCEPRQHRADAMVPAAVLLRIKCLRSLASG